MSHRIKTLAGNRLFSLAISDDADAGEVEDLIVEMEQLAAQPLDNHEWCVPHEHVQPSGTYMTHTVVAARERAASYCDCRAYVPDSSGDAACGNCGADYPPVGTPPHYGDSEIAPLIDEARLNAAITAFYGRSLPRLTAEGIAREYNRVPYCTCGAYCGDGPLTDPCQHSPTCSVVRG